MQTLKTELEAIDVVDLTNDFTPHIAENLQQLALKVDKVEGKGLSTEDYTTAEKAEVAKVALKADKTC